MRNLFTPLVHSVVVGGITYPLRTDHFTALRVCAALEDPQLTAFEQQAIVLALLYKTVPSDKAEALRLASLFLNGGTEPSQADSVQSAPLYSLTHDAPFIYTAIQKTHGIDVLAQPMHWHRFCALLQDIDETTFFARLIYLRSAQRKGTLTQAERAVVASLGTVMALPSNTSPNADAIEFLQLLGTEKTHQKEEASCTTPQPTL